MVISLHTTLSPVSREGRNRINENWDRIIAGLTKIQQQINVLAGGEELEELIRRLNETVEKANIAVQDAIKAKHDATQEAIEANNAALQTALNTVSQALLQMSEAIVSVNTATSEANIAATNANNARDAALKAVQDVIDTISTMQMSIQEYKDSFNHKDAYQNEIQYRKNNEVLYNGSTYRAKMDTLGNPPPTTIGVSNTHWQLVARRGDDAPVSSLFGVWRGPTPPTNKQMLWWFDNSLVQGYETQIWVGPTAPDNTNILWLNTGGA